MSYSFNELEMNRIQSAAALCSGGGKILLDEGNWVPLYTELSKLLQEKMESGTLNSEDYKNAHNAKLWLDVAIGANGKTGMHNAFIRTYTQRQGKLRTGTNFSEKKMQLASNGVAFNLYKDLIKYKYIPSITDIAKADASSIGENLFGDILDPSDTAVLLNSAWAGTIGFNLLGGATPFETWRLLSGGGDEGATASLNSLMDIRDLLFAADSYTEALKAAYIQGGKDVLNTIAEFAIRSADPAIGPEAFAAAIQPLVAQLNIMVSSGDLTGCLILVTKNTPKVREFFELYKKFSKEEILDMLRGAIQGKTLIGNTTPENYDDVAYNFFNSLSVEKLNSTSARLLPADKSALIEAAKSDTNIRVALGSLSYIAIQTEEGVREKFSLYNDMTGEGHITEEWIRDRVEMLSSLGDSPTDSYYLDQSSNTTTGSGEDTRSVIFGSENGDTQNGGSGQDKLYGGMGNDTQTGGQGNDYLEGGDGDDSLMGGLDADTLIGGNGSDVLRGEEGNDLLNGGSGNDVYKFYGSFGSDLIIDSSGNDSLEVQGFIYGLPVGKKIKSGTGNTYQSDDGQVTYFLLQTGPITDLVISFEGKPEKIRIRNFDSQTRNFGITLEDTTPVEPPVNHVFTGDFIKSNPSGDKYLLTDDRKNYVSAGQQESAQDVINGTDDKDSIFGLGGNDGLFGGDGADFIDGGEGSDLILGGTGQDTVVGNAGHDFIFGSATRGFSLKTDPDSPPPTATGLELARGFNWVAYNPPGVDERGTDAIVIAGANTWALNDAGFVESTGNFIDGGTGEDYIAAGTGKDTVYGGADNDSIWGMGFGDVVFGDDGNDQIRGDGSTIDYIQYTPAEFHGDDILDGGSGNDTVVGQGGADEIYGGTGDDVLLGDDDQFDSTPASVHDKDNVYGGEGNDQLFGGGADDQLFGGTGNDSLWGDDDDDLSDSLKGNDLLDGEEGDDQLIGGAGNDTVIGGAGKDKMWGDFNAARYENSIATGNDHLRGDAGDDTVIGGAGNDMLFGGADNDLLIGDDGLAAPNTVGNDTLHGEAGNDTLEGWAGDDLLDGGVGKDHLYGDAGTDSLTGGSGDDFLYGEDGDDSLIGGEGTDGLEGGSGNDTYILNAGDSPISTLGLAEGLTDTSGKNKVVFGSGVNLSGVTTGFTSEGHLYIQYTQSDLLLVVGATKQTLRFEFQTTGETLSAAQLISRTNADTVQMTDSNGQRQTYGSSSSNTILARSTDLAYGGQGSDLIIGSESGINVLYSKGDGEDRIQAIKDSSGVNLNRLAFDQGVNASDLTWSIKDNTLRLSLINNNPADAIVIDGFDPANAVTSLAIDQFLFSDGNVLTAAQLLSKGTKSFGTTAADIQQGSIGNDTFVGSGGDDTLKGWQGSDTYAWSTDLGDDVIDDGATSAVDIDVINASEEIRPEDVALNQFGNDLLIRSRLGGGTIRVVGQFSGTGIEQLTFANGVSWDATYISTHLTNELTESADNYSGNASDNVINARGGNDMVRGNDGNDYIEGGAGNDSLFGNNQNDTLIGGLGTDSLNGGTGDDVLDGRSDSAADTLVGGAGSDTYLFGRGGGIDITDETGATTSDVDVLKFDSTVKPGDLIVSYNGGAFKFSIAGTTDAIWARMSMPERTDLTGIKRIEFESGGTWSISDVRARVIANASTPGNDSFNAFDSDDVIDVRAGNDGVYALGGNDYVDGGAGNDTLMGDSGNDTLIGGAGTDTLYGGDGNDELIDGENLWGGKGNDTYRITSSTEHRVIYEDADVPENVDVLYLPFASTVTSVARSYNKGTYGSDNVVFYEIGAGNGSSVTIDKFLFSPSADNKVELIRFTDGVEWTINDVLQRDGCSPATTGSDSILGHRWDESFDGLDGNDLINGERGNDTVFGGAGNDTLYGGLGSDYLSGGTGNDTIYGDDGDDTYLLSSNGSHDTIYMGNGQDQIRFDTGIKPEDVSLFKNGNDLIVCINQERNQSTFINYFGGSTQLGGAIFEGGQIWTATDISSRIVRGTQNTITGTSGNDTFEVDSTDDVISEGTSNGTDLVMSSVSFSLQANIENLQLTGYLDTYGGGNDLNNQIVGNAGNNRISGASGSDTLIGGQGDDTYWVSSSPLMVSEAPSDDLIIESENAGTDTVITSTYHYTLDANVENLITESWTNSYSLVRGYGTSRTYPIPRRLTGNALDNVIDSRKWDASARIDGGLGADTMYGTRYNDTFVIDNIGDVIVDGFGNSDVDTIESSIEFTLDDRFDNLVLTGTAKINGFGNKKSNSLDGYLNSASNTLAGGLGDDTYRIGAGDTYIESENSGYDTLIIATGITGSYSISNYQNIEALGLDDSMGTSSISGASTNDKLIGNRENNIIDGGDGDDLIIDGPDRLYDPNTGELRLYQVDSDVLLGGAGNDTIYSVSESFMTQYSADTIDGGAGDDSIYTGNSTSSSRLDVVFGYGSGKDIVYGYGNAGATGYISLNNSTSISDLVFTRENDSLVVGLANSSDSITWMGFYSDETSSNLSNRLYGIKLFDGTYLYGDAIAQRVANGNSNDSSDASDVLIGTAGGDALSGLGGDDQIYGADGHDTLNGGDGYDNLWGASGDDVLTAGPGGGSLHGQAGNDTYRYERGDGEVWINEDAGGADSVVFGNGISPSNLVVNRDGTCVTFTLLDSPNDVLYVYGFFESYEDSGEPGSRDIERVVFADGTNWSADKIRELTQKLTGTSASDTLIGSDTNDSIFGLGGNDSLTGGDFGDDLLDGGAGVDTMSGGTGNDKYIVDSGSDRIIENVGEGFDVVEATASYTLSSNIESLYLLGTANISGTGNGDANNLTGNIGNNTLTGNGGNDTLDGGAGTDTLVGGTGDDVYFVDSSADVITESSGQGNDVVFSSSTYTLGANVESLTLTGTANLGGTGNASNNRIEGNAGNNLINGGTGNDTMVGGAGDDTYVVDSSLDLIEEAVGGGIDAVQSSVTYSIASDANIENLTLTGTATANATGNTANNLLTGNSAANTLSGGAGNDTLSGGAGNDTMVGGTGDDTYIVDVTTDVITEAINEGIDTVQSAITFSLAAINNVENLTLLGTSAVNATGNTLNNRLMGNSAANVIDGGVGADTMVGGAGNDSYVVDNSLDVVTEAAGEGTDLVTSSVSFTLSANVENLTLSGTSAISATGNELANTLTGNSAANTLNGGAGNDTLNGGTGADTLVGGIGDDSYIVDNTADVVTELSSEGLDTVQSSVTYSLATYSNVENLTLTGTTAINGTGNGLNNVLTGNSAVNTLNGGAGNDTLNGGAGADSLIGGAGDDVYFVDNTSDKITENAGEGMDLVQSSVTWTLGTNIEHLTLTGTSAINGTGNTLDNWLIGNSAVNKLTGGAGNDSLEGGAGADSMIGGTGNDTYFVDNASDKITENANEGIDTVQSAITWTLGANLENITLTGSSAINATGNTLSNLLTGNSGNNTLTGGGGNDTYKGGQGNDTLTSSVSASNDTYVWGRGEGADTLTDAGGTDQLSVLSGVSADQLWFRRVGTNLEVSVIGTADSFVINSWYSSSANQIESMKLSDGKTLTSGNVQKLVDAMAQFAAPAAGQTTLPANYQSTLNPVIAANWV